MSSTLPSFDNDYFVSTDTKLNPATLNLIFGGLATRIRALQGVSADWDAALAEKSTELANAILQASVVPQFNLVVTNLNGLLAQIEAAEDQLAALQAGGVEAVNVPLADNEYWPENTDAQEAFELVFSTVATSAAALEALGETLVAGLSTIEKPQKHYAATVNMDLVAGRQYRIMAAGITLSLPANPSAHDTVRLVDGGALGPAATATLARNGQSIMGLAQNLTLNMSGFNFRAWFDGATWRLD